MEQTYRITSKERKQLKREAESKKLVKCKKCGEAHTTLHKNKKHYLCEKCYKEMLQNK